MMRPLSPSPPLEERAWGEEASHPCKNPTFAKKNYVGNQQLTKNHENIFASPPLFFGMR
jgi:hypothetical protein